MIETYTIAFFILLGTYVFGRLILIGLYKLFTLIKPKQRNDNIKIEANQPKIEKGEDSLRSVELDLFDRLNNISKSTAPQIHVGDFSKVSIPPKRISKKRAVVK